MHDFKPSNIIGPLTKVILSTVIFYAIQYVIQPDRVCEAAPLKLQEIPKEVKQTHLRQVRQIKARYADFFARQKEMEQQRKKRQTAAEQLKRQRQREEARYERLREQYVKQKQRQAKVNREVLRKRWEVQQAKEAKQREGIRRLYVKRKQMLEKLQLQTKRIPPYQELSIDP